MDPKKDETSDKLRSVEGTTALMSFFFIIFWVLIYGIAPITFSIIILIIGIGMFIFMVHKTGQWRWLHNRGKLHKDFLTDTQYKILKILSNTLIALMFILPMSLRLLRLILTKNWIIIAILLPFFIFSTMISLLIYNPKLVDKFIK